MNSAATVLVLIPGAVALLVLLVFTYLYEQNRHSYFRAWQLAWAAYVLHYAAEAVNYFVGRSALSYFASSLFRVAMATLDTVDPEPLPAGHWLYEHPKVRLSAHVSWYEPELQQAAMAIFIDNIGRFNRGEGLREVVDPDEGY